MVVATGDEPSLVLSRRCHELSGVRTQPILRVRPGTCGTWYWLTDTVRLEILRLLVHFFDRSIISRTLRGPGSRES